MQSVWLGKLLSSRPTIQIVLTIWKRRRGVSNQQHHCAIIVKYLCRYVDLWSDNMFASKKSNDLWMDQVGRFLRTTLVAATLCSGLANAQSVYPAGVQQGMKQSHYRWSDSKGNQRRLKMSHKGSSSKSKHKGSKKRPLDPSNPFWTAKGSAPTGPTNSGAHPVPPTYSTKGKGKGNIFTMNKGGYASADTPSYKGKGKGKGSSKKMKSSKGKGK